MRLLTKHLRPPSPAHPARPTTSREGRRPKPDELRRQLRQRHAGRRKLLAEARIHGRACGADRRRQRLDLRRPRPCDDHRRALGLGPGISLTTIAFLLLLWCIWQSWLVVRCGRALNSPVRPSKGETSRLIKRGVLADLAGITLAVLGYQSLAGSLFVQASQQVPGFFGAQIQATPGVAGRVIGLPITSIEMLAVLGNTQVLFAHLIGLWISLWLLQRVYRTA
jgi:hypothetical protein